MSELFEQLKTLNQAIVNAYRAGGEAERSKNEREMFEREQELADLSEDNSQSNDGQSNN